MMRIRMRVDQKIMGEAKDAMKDVQDFHTHAHHCTVHLRKAHLNA